LFLKEYPTKKQAFFCIVPVVGVIIITISGKELGVVTFLGVVFLGLTMLSSAFYKTVNRKASVDFTPYERTLLVLAISALVFNISGLGAIKWDMKAYVMPLADLKYILSVMCLSLLCSILANILVNYSLGKMSLFKVAAFGSLSTLCSSIAGIVFLKEPVSAALIVGGVLILIGVFLVTMPKKIKSEQSAE
jgi:drug/metabolite transporter (DMT)-like permease